VALVREPLYFMNPGLTSALYIYRLLLYLSLAGGRAHGHKGCLQGIQLIVHIHTWKAFNSSHTQASTEADPAASVVAPARHGTHVACLPRCVGGREGGREGGRDGERERERDSGGVRVRRGWTRQYARD